MNQSSSEASSLGVGVITVITVLLVLLLSIFAALTFSTARADLALSKVNADTVTAYYSADARAAEHYGAFARGNDETREESIPISSRQFLHIRLGRSADGTPVIFAWETVPVEVEESELSGGMDLWSGESPR